QWPIIIIRLTAELTNNADYGNLRLMGRRLSALCDVLALFVIYLIGARLYSRRVGLLAAALSALAVMQIQQSHFMTSDNFAVFFVTLTMYCAVRVAQKGEWWWYGLFGVSFGMAVASRVNLAPLAVEIVVAAFIANSDELLHGKADTRLTAGFGGTMAMLALAGIASLVTFRVLHPMSFRAPSGDTTIFTLTPNPDWTASLAVAQAESSGAGG
ncbi:MAG: glycosyltransferase family 39 protein, partial [Chloroflexota bacterium]